MSTKRSFVAAFAHELVPVADAVLMPPLKAARLNEGEHTTPALTWDILCTLPALDLAPFESRGFAYRLFQTCRYFQEPVAFHGHAIPRWRTLMPDLMVCAPEHCSYKMSLPTLSLQAGLRSLRLDAFLPARVVRDTKVFAFMPLLRHLRLMFPWSADRAVPWDIGLSRLTSLESLQLCFPYDSNRSVGDASFLRAMPRLTALDLDEARLCRPASVTAAELWAPFAASLASLKMNSYKSAEHVPLETLTALTELAISEQSSQPRVAQRIANLPRLAELSLTSSSLTRSLGGAPFLAAGAFAALTTLNLSFVCVDLGVLAAGPGARLLHLTLAGCNITGRTADAPEGPAFDFPALRSLYLTLCYGPLDNGARDVKWALDAFSPMQALETFSFNNSGSLDLASLASLSRLQSLTVQGRSTLHSPLIAESLAALTRLTALDLSGVRDIDDAALLSGRLRTHPALSVVVLCQTGTLPAEPDALFPFHCLVIHTAPDPDSFDE